MEEEMNGITMSNISQTNKISSATLTIDFVVTTAKVNKKFEKAYYEMITRKAEVESKNKNQAKKAKSYKVDDNKTLEKQKTKPKAEKTAEVKKAEIKSEIGNKIDKKV